MLWHILLTDLFIFFFPRLQFYCGKIRMDFRRTWSMETQRNTTNILLTLHKRNKIFTLRCQQKRMDSFVCAYFSFWSKISQLRAESPTGTGRDIHHPSFPLFTRQNIPNFPTYTSECLLKTQHRANTL